MNDSNTTIQKYKEMGYKVTPQRMAILNSLQGDKSHPSVHDIYGKLKGDFPTISLATVYNTLEILKDIGEVVELTVDKNKVRYDPDTSIHDHILCVQCRKVEDVPSINESIYPENLNIEGYRLLGVSNQFYGVCSKCE